MNFDDWLRANPYPSMKELLLKYGRYNLIPKDEWDKLDAAQADWQRKRRERTQDDLYDHIGKKLGKKF